MGRISLIDSVRKIWPVLFCLVAQTYTTVVVRAEDDFPFFETKIRPLMVEHCYECHSVKHGVVEANFNMDTRNGMLSGGDRGIATVSYTHLTLPTKRIV